MHRFRVVEVNAFVILSTFESLLELPKNFDKCWWKLIKIFEKCYAGIVGCFATDGERKNLWCRIIYVNRMPCWFVSPCSLTFLRRHAAAKSYASCRSQQCSMLCTSSLASDVAAKRSIFSRKFMICYKTASRVMIFSISTSLMIVCSRCKTPCSTISSQNTGGNILTLVTMAAICSLTKCKNAPIGRDSASA